MSMVELTSVEKKLADRVDANVTRELAISDRAGGIGFVSMNEVMEFAKLMAISSIAVRKHLRGNPGACLAICIQALEWQMSPYSVANKSYSVNDQLSYEAQLIEAVILRRAPIRGRPKIEFSGDGEKRVCRIWAELRDEPGEIVEYVSPIFNKITPKNSPLWKADPDQQHFYYSARAWCRRHFPDILLGVYARDELEDSEPLAAAIGIRTSPSKNISARLDALASIGTQENVDQETGEITLGEPTQTYEPDLTEADVDGPQHPETSPCTVGKHVAAEAAAPAIQESAGVPVTVSIEDQAREAANHGEGVFRAFYKTRNPSEKATLNAMGDELRGMMPK